jgi:predicted dehydrogenase
MDYTSQKLNFKIKKTLRYIELYGISRTFVKIKGQYHMKKKYDVIPKSMEIPKNKPIALIGCGNYAYSNLAYYLKKNFGHIIGAVMDIDINKAVSLAKEYKVPFFTTDAFEIINNDNIKIIYIASNHASHAEYAIKCIERGKDVYIEKPHVVNEEQLFRLYKIISKTNQKVFLGFNRPYSVLGNLIFRYLQKEEGIGLYNWFISGHEIDPDHWYFRNEEGGRILGNVCHWTDFLFQLIPKDEIFPITIIPTRGVKSDSNIAITYKFGDGSIGAITFSAMGHTFEGVREKFNAHKANCLITLDDFQKLRIDIIEKVIIKKLRKRDHGHEKNIVDSYKKSIGKLNYNIEDEIFRIINTAYLFLKTKEALDTDRKLTIDEYKPSL